MYAKIIIEYPVKTLDKCFTYEVPEDMVSDIKVGMKVLVPFGKNTVFGIVLELTSAKPNFITKKIYRIDNKDIYLNEELLKLGKYLQEKTLCTLITAYQTMLPSALKVKSQNKSYDKFDTYYTLNKSLDEVNKYIVENEKRFKQISILDMLIKGDVLKKDINSSSTKTLEKLGLIKEIKVKKYRLNNEKKEIKDTFNLTKDQKEVYDKVSLDKYGIYLLEGVTGSGKTEVYMHLISDALGKGKTAIVLVPEICLTTQTVKRFYDRFGSDVAVFHSGLTPGEKYDEYLKIYRGEVKIVVGTRSSIFVPLKDLGIIIIDEEHSETYRQDSNPRYDAKDMADFRAKYHNCPLLLASATPTLESRARADKKVYTLLTLKNRVNNMVLPKVEMVDMALELKQGHYLFSSVLKEKIKDRLQKKEQIILLLNRRGFATYITCSSCGYTYKCPNCDITLTYHKTSNNLRCHYCGYVTKKDDVCPKCHENSLNYLGVGTQKVEQMLQELYPDARIIRMDQDTTTKKGSYQRIIDDFADNKYDILLGTQMISKGLDFKNVTLVGIINADTSLNLPDFRANEKTFDLLYQTAGRAGRDKKMGEVIVQTFNPDNEVLNYVKNNDYDGFYLYEMNIRHKLKYPPYTYICLIVIKSANYDLCAKVATDIKKYMEPKVDAKTIIYGPTPASVFRVNNIYHFQITIKYTFDNNLNQLLKEIENIYNQDKVELEITFNPARF